MNTLHTFGCSYTAAYETSGNRAEYIKYKEYRGGSYPKIWPELLSEKLNLKLNNTAVGGASNYEILQSFCDNVEKFQEGDIVIIGWSYKERFRVVDYFDGTFVKVGAGYAAELYNISKNTIEEILFNRAHEKWLEEIQSWEKAIRRLCYSSKVQLVFWSFDSNIYKDSLDYDLRQLGAETITMETRGKVPDTHYGEQGHRIQSEYFFQLLNNLNNKKLI